MAEDQTPPIDNEESTAAGRKGPGPLIWAALGLTAAVGGFAVPFVLPAADEEPVTERATVPPGLRPPAADQLGFVSFGEVTVNLDEGRLNRYLRLGISLQVAKSDMEPVSKLIEQRKAVLKNWLLSHLSDKGMDDIRGAAGQNRLRREIHDQFNSVLFPDGYDRIYDVLFEEFNVQ